MCVCVCARATMRYCHHHLMAFPGCLGVQEEEINSQTKLRLGYQYKDTKMWLC